MAAAACGGSNTFEIERAAPAATATVSQVPLHVPPEYAVRPGSETATVSAPRPRLTELSPGESALLALAGANRSNPRIRDVVDEESTSLAVVDAGFVERLVLGPAPPPPPGLIIRRTGSTPSGDLFSFF